MKPGLTAIATASIAFLFIAPPAAVAAPGSTAGASAYQVNCTMCHGDNGAGSDVGKSLQAPDLRSHKVQSMSDAALVHTISEGNGAMPAFKDRLSAAEIHGVARYLRTLASSAPAAR